MIRKRYIVIGIAVAALVAAALVVWLLVPEDRSRRLSVPQAVRMFEAQSGPQPGGASGGARPPFGVYRYTTRGGEAVDTALFDGGHDYDGVSTVTLLPGECGVIERWQVLEGRWREAEGCAEGGSEAASSLRELHEFFESPQRAAYACSGPATSDPANLRPGRRLVTTCRSANGSVRTVMGVTAAAPLAVDGRAVAAVLVRGSSSIEGDSAGAAEFEDWRRRSDGLLLRRVVASRIESDEFGGMRYSEDYELRLISLVPLQE